MNNLIRYVFLFIAIMLLTACAGKPPNIAIPVNPPKAPQLISPPRVALVLGGGGARGYAHLGVLQVLQQAGVPLDLIVGTSAGSIFGAVYSDNHSFDKTYRIMMRANFWTFADINNSPNKSGFIQGYHLERMLMANMRAKNFSQLKNKFVAVATDLGSGQTYFIQSGPIPPAVLASSALPGLVDPVFLYHKTLVDGGVAQPVPVEVAQDFHPRVIIAVNISQPLDPKVPYFSYSIYNRSYDIMWQSLVAQNERGADIIIRPAVGEAGTFDLDDRDRLYQAGRTAALKQLPKILALLKQNHIQLHTASIKMVQ